MAIPAVVRAVVCSGVLVAAACTSAEEGAVATDAGATRAGPAADSESADLSASAVTTTSTAPSTTTDPPLPSVDLDVQIGFEQLTVVAGEPGSTIVARQPFGDELARADVLESGSALLRDLPSGAVELEIWEGARIVATGPVVVVAGADPPPPAHYGQQEIERGFGYITTRDGTTLSTFVTLPGPVDDGPYPTLIEYSGYDPSNPGRDDPARILIPALGYALVQVNVRGTGCSGGSFDAFEPIQGIDGYDVVETVAAQPWSDGIGMWGVSYPGIMQLHVAATRPPSLDAIAPLSVIDRVDSVLYPGGIYNNGFGESWSRQVSQRAEADGQPWARNKAQSGDAECAANQALRVHNPDLVETVKANPYSTDLTERRSTEPKADQIAVPVFLAGGWQDEQTGGRFPALLDELTAAPVLRANLYNGLHADSLGPDVLVSLIEFYDLYVANRAPDLDFLTRALISAGFSAIYGRPLAVPGGSYRGLSYEQARAAFEAEQPIRVLFELGATAPSLPVARFEAGFEQWPPTETTATRWHLLGTSRLHDRPSPSTGAATYTTDPAEGALVTVSDVDALWSDEPGWTWVPAAPANRATFTSGVMGRELTLVGSASVDLWVTVDGPDADVEVTLSEIAPDGSETFIQTGWLRLSRRALSAEATELRPMISGLESDVAELVPNGDPVLARVETLPFAHVLRSDSRLRLTVDTPGASHPTWRFDVLPDPVDVTIHTGGTNDSSIALPVIASIDPPDGRPACGSLRAQPCRNG